jgi:8-oxo-dGTP diphosphatase
MHREILEEAGLYCEELELRGTISWPGFGKDGEDWLGFIFRITKYTGELLQENHEGTLQWVPVEKVESLNLWEGDRFFLPMVFDRNGKSFHGVMPYRNGLPVSWSYTTL